MIIELTLCPCLDKKGIACFASPCILSVLQALGSFLMAINRLNAQMIDRLTNSAKCIPATTLVCIHIPSSVSHKQSSLKQNHTFNISLR